MKDKIRVLTDERGWWLLITVITDRGTKRKEVRNSRCKINYENFWFLIHVFGLGILFSTPSFLSLFLIIISLELNVWFWYQRETGFLIPNRTTRSLGNWILCSWLAEAFFKIFIGWVGWYVLWALVCIVSSLLCLLYVFISIGTWSGIFEYTFFESLIAFHHVFFLDS